MRAVVGPASFLSALWAFALIAAPAGAQPVTLISQQRGVSASVYAPSCTPPSQIDWRQASDFADFDAGAQASRCLFPVEAAADQRSLIAVDFGAGDSIQAHGAAGAISHTPAQAHAASVFRIAFRLDAGARLTTRGQLNAHADTPAPTVYALLHLLDGAGATILLVQTDPQGWPAGLDIDDTRDLPPGTYALESQSAADLAAPGTGAASFDITATFAPRRCTPDFDGDGNPATDADIEAFFACLAGECCTACVGPDFDGDADAATDRDIESFFRVLAGGPC
jgi:hypothetical protein